MTTPIATPVLPAKPSTFVDVSYDENGEVDAFHRPGQKDPKHSGPLHMNLRDAQIVAVPCPVCFPPERTDDE